MSISTEPLVSIVVPVYNVEPFLTACIESIVNQDYDNVEIILINDGSTDLSGDICADFAEKFNNIIFKSQLNAGQAMARNAGVDLASGRYLMFVDSDDALAPQAVSILVDYMLKSSPDFCCFGLSFVDSNGRTHKEFVNAEFSVLSGKSIFHDALLDRGILSSACSKMYSMDFLRASRIVFPDVRYNEDVYYSRALAFYADKVILIPEILYFANIRDGSTSRHFNPNVVEVSARVVELERNLFLPVASAVDVDYINAHFIKFYSYLLIQAALRVEDGFVYNDVVSRLRSAGFFALLSESSYLKVLSGKNRLLARLCSYPLLLRCVSKLFGGILKSKFVY